MNEAFDIAGKAQWRSHADSLYHYFCRNNDNRCLLWVNPAQEDPFSTVPSVQDRRVNIPINHPRFNPALAPYLVPLHLGTSADRDLLYASVKCAWEAWSHKHLRRRLGQPIAGWIETPENPRSLAHYWGTRCHLHRRNGHSWLLRFHDPGVREWLWPTLTTSQQRALFGGALTLLGLDRAQELMRHERPEIAQAEILSSDRLTLDDAQWAQVGAHATVHAAWIHLNALSGKISEPLTSAQATEVFGALIHAVSYGIAGDPDLELFALHVLQMNADFHLSAQMCPVWERTARGEFYGAAVSAVFNLPAEQLHTHLPQFHRKTI